MPHTKTRVRADATVQKATARYQRVGTWVLFLLVSSLGLQLLMIPVGLFSLSLTQVSLDPWGLTQGIVVPLLLAASAYRLFTSQRIQSFFIPLLFTHTMLSVGNWFFHRLNGEFLLHTGWVLVLVILLSTYALWVFQRGKRTMQQSLYPPIGVGILVFLTEAASAFSDGVGLLFDFYVWLGETLVQLTQYQINLFYLDYGGFVVISMSVLVSLAVLGIAALEERQYRTRKSVE